MSVHNKAGCKGSCEMPENTHNAGEAQHHHSMSFHESNAHHSPRKHNWIKGAVSHPGALHRDLGVKQGKKIPVSKIREAAKGNDVTAKRARFALTMRKINS